MTLITESEIVELGLASGLSAVGLTNADVLEPALSALRERKAAGLASSMQFTYRNPERSTNPLAAMADAKTLIAGAYAYGPREPATSGVEPTATEVLARVARYAHEDYYSTLKQALTKIADRLIADGFKARVIADTNELVDRNVAWRAGLGWYGKNSNLLISRGGSWHVLGAVITNAEIESTAVPVADQCGSCQSCIDDCPTGAIVAPGVIDARKCLAWLVQAPGEIPIEFREVVGDRIYGCDDCQEVCPPNKVQLRIKGAEQSTKYDAWVDVVWILNADDDEILTRLQQWYIAKRDPDHVRRTALVVLGNVAKPGQPDTVELLKRFINGESELLSQHAVWAARRLGLDRLVTGAATRESVATEMSQDVSARFSSADWDLEKA